MPIKRREWRRIHRPASASSARVAPIAVRLDAREPQSAGGQLPRPARNSLLSRRVIRRGVQRRPVPGRLSLARDDGIRRRSGHIPGCAEIAVFATNDEGRRIPVFSELNPPACRDCHGDDPRPIWDAYPVWPGAYGEVDDAATVQRPPRASPRFSPSAQRTHGTAFYWVPSLSLRSFGPPRTPPTLARRHRPATRTSASSCNDSSTGPLAGRSSVRPRFGAYRYALLAALDPQCLDFQGFGQIPLLGLSVANYQM